MDFNFLFLREAENWQSFKIKRITQLGFLVQFSVEYIDSTPGADDSCEDLKKDLFSLSFIYFMTRNLSLKGGGEKKWSDIICNIGSMKEILSVK